MQRLGAFFVWVLVLTLTASGGLGADAPLTTESLLAKWEAASKGRQTNAAFTRIEYGEQFGYRGRLREQTGRFYCDDSGRGFYKLDDERLIVWEKESLLIVEFTAKTYIRWTQPEIEDARKRLVELENASWWRQFERISLFPLAVAQPDDVLPLCGEIDAQSLQKRFDVTWSEVDGKLFVKARPKERRDAERFHQIDVQLSPDTFDVLAHRWIESLEHSWSPEAPRTVVHIFTASKEETPPPDLDQQMHPQLDGFRSLLQPTDAGTQSGVQSAGANGVQK